MDFSTFLGRFHPIVVHLPIGFTIAALILEYVFLKLSEKSKIIATLWLMAFVGVVLATFSGYMLGDTGLYRPEEISLHKWLGFALLPLTLVGWLLKKGKLRSNTWGQHIFNFSFLIFLTVQGHQGGNLTHGEGYLVEFAPNPIRSLAKIETVTPATSLPNNPDSIQVYAGLVAPIFENKCISCHNGKVRRGGLDLSHPDSLMVGGDNGPILFSGKAAESELFERITLPQTNIKFMPPTKKILTYDEIKVVEWWIAHGASFEARITEMEVPEDISKILLKTYGIDTKPKPWYETVILTPLDSVPLQSLTGHGFRVKTLSDENALLDIKYIGNDLTEEKLLELEKVKDYITRLSLASTTVQDDWLSIISNFPNLTRLQLEKTSVTDNGIRFLSQLKHLESLNLYGTQVTNSCLSYIANMESLERVYLWNTKVTPDQALVLEKNAKGLEVIIGAR